MADKQAKPLTGSDKGPVEKGGCNQEVVKTDQGSAPSQPEVTKPKTKSKKKNIKNPPQDEVHYL